ncbi:hypothetical protein DL764_006429 [Monosporascus ibericus]|uniref:Rieske domain-containing protein n=1 Tax=Monosporascus ibericus TaxID=155417 RepID=A0A4Q4T537_9PEZI|nr:hypothetical protein DL764_006429 [Monosporascus ibericus]
MRPSDVIEIRTSIIFLRHWIIRQVVSHRLCEQSHPKAPHTLRHPSYPAPAAGAPWTFIGLASSFPNVELDGASLTDKRSCGSDSAAGCKVFQIPRATGSGVVADDAAAAEEVPLGEGEEARSPEYLRRLKDQVLVFRSKEKFYAADNRCPHSSYPLSNGAPFGVEDFGIIWSSWLTCPKHGWSFDLVTGPADRGNYRLGVWDVQWRPLTAVDQSSIILSWG